MSFNAISSLEERYCDRNKFYPDFIFCKECGGVIERFIY